MDKQIYVYRDGSAGKFEIIAFEKIIFFRNEKDVGEPLIIYKYADTNNSGTIFARTERGFHKEFELYHKTMNFQDALKKMEKGRVMNRKKYINSIPYTIKSQFTYDDIQATDWFVVQWFIL